jgi:hypothetical protein
MAQVAEDQGLLQREPQVLPLVCRLPLVVHLLVVWQEVDTNEKDDYSGKQDRSTQSQLFLLSTN